MLALAMRLCLQNLTHVKVDSETEICRSNRRNIENCHQSYISSHYGMGLSNVATRCLETCQSDDNELII